MSLSVTIRDMSVTHEILDLSVMDSSHQKTTSVIYLHLKNQQANGWGLQCEISPFFVCHHRLQSMRHHLPWTLIYFRDALKPWRHRMQELWN